MVLCTTISTFCKNTAVCRERHEKVSSPFQVRNVVGNEHGHEEVGERSVFETFEKTSLYRFLRERDHRLSTQDTSALWRNHSPEWTEDACRLHQ